MAKKKKVKKEEPSEKLLELTKFVSEIKEQIESGVTVTFDATHLERIKKMLCGTPGNPCP